MRHPITCGAPIETTAILTCALFLLDIREFQVMNAEDERAFGPPARTTIQAAALPGPGAAVENDRIVCVQ